MTIRQGASTQTKTENANGETSPPTTTTATTSGKAGMTGLTSETLSKVADILQCFGTSDPIPSQFDSKGFHSDFIRGLLKTHRVDRGRISSLLSVKHPVLNAYGTLHGGAVASVAEIMSIACARTIVGEDKELFLGELRTSYLSAAPHNAELTVDASVIRSGKSLTLIAVEFKAKGTGKLVFTSQATFYHMPVASL